MVKSVAKDLIAHGKISRGYIGVNIGEVDDALAKSLGLDRPKGIIVQGIVEGGAASKADIKEGDVILKVDGREVDQPNQLQGYVASKSAGTTIKLTLFRDGKEIERNVTLKARDEDSKAEPIVNKENEKDASKDSKASTAQFEDLGFSVANLSSKEKSEFKVDHGVIIKEVKSFSKAEDRQLAAGFIILEADKKRINNVADLREVISDKKGAAVLLKLQDGKGNNFFRGIEIPE